MMITLYPDCLAKVSIFVSVFNITLGSERVGPAVCWRWLTLVPESTLPHNCQELIVC